MSDTTTTVHTLYRPGDKVRFRFGNSADPADAGSLYGYYEGVLSADLWSSTLRVTAADQTMRPEGVTLEDAPNLNIISPDGATTGYAIHDVTLIERFGLPVWLLDKSDHAALFAERFNDVVTHALVFTSTSTGKGGSVLTVPYAPAAGAGWQIGASELTASGLPADHALLGEEGWWVSKEALAGVGVKFPEDEPEPAPDPATLALDVADLRTRLEEALTNESHLRAKVAMLETTHEAMKREVGTVAMRYAREHGWCDTVREALEEVGIEPIDPRHEVWLTIRVKATGVPTSSDPSEDWTRQSISVDGSAIAQAIEFDSDWEDVEVDTYSVDFDVDSVETLED